jgi:hypothetical protein
MNLLTTGNILKMVSASLWGCYYAQETGAVKSFATPFPPMKNEEVLKATGELAREFAMEGKVDVVSCQDVIQSQGSSLFSCLHKTITMDSRIAEIDADVSKWLERREFCLLKSAPRMVMEGAACTSAIALSLLVPFPFGLVGSFGSTWFIGKFFRPIVKEEADDMAFSSASKDELKGALRLFRAAFLATSEFNKKHRGRRKEFFYNEAPADERLKKVEKALKVRFYFSQAALCDVLADQRVQDLKRHIKSRLIAWEKGSDK